MRDHFDDELEDMRVSYRPRYLSSCSDGMCGAYDCPRCYGSAAYEYDAEDQEEKEEEEEEEEENSIFYEEHESACAWGYE